MWISPQLIVIGIGPAVPEPSFVVVTLAVLLIVAQSALVVALTTCTLELSPEARSCGPKLSTPPTIDQPAEAGLIDQLRSEPAGSVSLTVTLRAIPAPVFVTVTV